MAKASGIKAGQAYIALGTDNSAFTKGLDAAQKRLKAFGAAVTAIGAAVTAAGAAGLGGMFQAAKAFSDAGDKIDKAAIRTGLSAEAVSELGFAAEQSGASLEDLETGFRRFQQTLGDAAKGEAAAASAIQGIGLSVEGLLALDPEAQLEALADAIATIEDPAMRVEAAMGLLGRGGAQLIPLLEGGSRAMRDLRREARELGLTFTEADAKGAAALNDALNGLNRQFKALWHWIGSAIAPVMTEAIRLIQPIVGAVVEWVRANKPLIATIGLWSGVIAAAGVAITAVGIGIVALGAVLGGIATILSAVGTMVAGIVAAVTKLPLLLAVVGAGAVAAFTDLRRHAGTALVWLKAKLGALRDFANQTWQGMADALATGDLRGATEIAWTALELAWRRGSEDLLEVWRKLKVSVGQVSLEMAGGLVTALGYGFAGVWTAWANLLSKVKLAWSNAVGWMADAFLVFAGTIDSKFDVKGAQKRRREVGKAAAKEIAADRDRAIKEADKLRKTIGKETAKALRDAEKRLAKSDKPNRKQAQAEIDALQAKLDALTEEAKLRRIMTEEGQKQLDQVEEIHRAGSRFINGARASFGSFSARAVQSFRPDDVKSGVERTAEAAEALERIGERIARGVDRMGNGLTFA